VDSARAVVRSVTASPDGRALRDVGRRARLELTFAERDGRTVLSHAYAEPPFRVGRCLPDGDGVCLIVASSAPGVFGGDALEQTVTVERGARVRLTSQSALQVHASPDGSLATVWSTYRVESGGWLSCEWDPLIPFPDARLDQRIHLDVAGDARLFWSDAFMNGREARGERWRFAQLSHELRLSIGGATAYIERYRVDRSEARPTRAWVAGEACYFGTMLRVDEDMDQETAANLHGSLAELIDVDGTADRLEKRLLLVRLMATSGVPFRQARALGADRLRA
jgi:urease accessory protein UreH